MSSILKHLRILTFSYDLRVSAKFFDPYLNTENQSNVTQSLFSSHSFSSIIVSSVALAGCELFILIYYKRCALEPVPIFHYFICFSRLCPAMLKLDQSFQHDIICQQEVIVLSFGSQESQGTSFNGWRVSSSRPR